MLVAASLTVLPLEAGVPLMWEEFSRYAPRLSLIEGPALRTNCADCKDGVLELCERLLLSWSEKQ